MIDIPKAKADAEEGLRIAADAESGPWWRVDFGGENGASCIMNEHFAITDGASGGEVSRSNGAFIADSRTRAPDAYRNVIALAERVGELEAELERVNGMNLRLGTSFDSARDRWADERIRLSELAIAAEAAEEKMTRKAEEHYDRAVKAEAERDALREELRLTNLALKLAQDPMSAFMQEEQST